MNQPTNDELNRWYHEYLGKCPHEYNGFFSVIACGGIWADNLKAICHCGKEWTPTPDYLSDPTVILGIIKELIRAGWDNIKFCDEGFIFDTPVPFGKISRPVFVDESLERAVMLALKAKHDS